MIDKQLIKDWIAALRSGEYEQGKQRLRTTENKFCCLGVLCDISNTGEWTPEFDTEYGFISKEGAIMSAFLPNNLDLEHHELELAQMNDQGYSFDEIADYIKQNILAEYE